MKNVETNNTKGLVIFSRLNLGFTAKIIVITYSLNNKAKAIAYLNRSKTNLSGTTRGYAEKPHHINITCIFHKPLGVSRIFV